MRCQAIYRCPVCGSTKTIVHDSEEPDGPDPNFPFKVVCGWRGCESEQEREADIVGDVICQRAAHIYVPKEVSEWTEKAQQIFFGD